MQSEFYETYMNYIFKSYQYMWLEVSLKAKWQLAAQGE